MKVAPPSLAPMLRSDTQGRLLARLFADPSSEYSLTDLVAWAGSSMPTISREINRAEQAGVVASRRAGPTRLIRANESHPLYPALSKLILGTYGPPAIIAGAFADLEGADAVVLYGSWAARYHGEPGRAPNDIDVLVIGDVDLDAMHDAADTAERQIGLPVQATARSQSAWLDANESFIREVRSRHLVPVLVNDQASALTDDLAALERTGEVTS